MKEVGLPFCGLPNRRQYACYQNSILQCLMATPGFNRSFTSEELPVQANSPHKGMMALRMRNIVKAYEATKMDKCLEN
jgi:ubiquitin C-terminal hydrolase